jgi:hypothetical protein
MIRKLFSMIALVIVAGYLLGGRGQWFADVERDARVGGEAVFSEQLDLSTSGTRVWNVPRDDWSFEEGEAQLSLVIDRVPGLSAEILNRNTLPLRMRVSAYGITESGEQFDRLIRNWYFKTDEPLGPDVRLWSFYSLDEVEHGLAGLLIYPYENTVVSIEIKNPDPMLEVGRPRLKLVGKYDYAVYEHLPILRLVRDGGLAISVMMLLGLVVLAWRPVGGTRRET